MRESNTGLFKMYSHRRCVHPLHICKWHASFELNYEHRWNGIHWATKIYVIIANSIWNLGRGKRVHRRKSTRHKEKTPRKCITAGLKNPQHQTGNLIYLKWILVVRVKFNEFQLKRKFLLQIVQMKQCIEDGFCTVASPRLSAMQCISWEIVCRRHDSHTQITK